MLAQPHVVAARARGTIHAVVSKIQTPTRGSIAAKSHASLEPRGGGMRSLFTRAENRITMPLCVTRDFMPVYLPGTLLIPRWSADAGDAINLSYLRVSATTGPPCPEKDGEQPANIYLFSDPRPNRPLLRRNRCAAKSKDSSDPVYVKTFVFVPSLSRCKPRKPRLREEEGAGRGEEG